MTNKTLGFGHIEDTGPSPRAVHTPRFDVKVTGEGSRLTSTITYAGEKFVVIKEDKRLPRGFHDRLVQHVFELLSGTRTTLWDEQAIYGEYTRDVDHVRSKAKKQATENLRRIEREIEQRPAGRK